MVVISALAALVDRVLTFLYFIPTMITLMRGDVRPESAAVAKARQWVMLGYLRQGATLIARLAALQAFALINRYRDDVRHSGSLTINSHQFLNAQKPAASQEVDNSRGRFLAGSQPRVSQDQVFWRDTNHQRLGRRSERCFLQGSGVIRTNHRRFIIGLTKR